MLGLAEGLARRGHEVWVVGQPGSPLMARVEEVALLTAETRRAQSTSGPSFGCSLRPFGLEPVRAKPLRLCGAFRPIAARMRGEWDLVGAVRLADVMRVFDPHILHGHTSHAHTLGLWAWVLSGRRAKVVVSRRVDFPVSRRGLGRIKYGWGVGRFIAVSDGVRRVLVEGGVPPSSVVVVRSGIDLGKFDGLKEPGDLYEEFGIARDVPLVGNVAALAPHKDQTCLLEAARRVVDAFPAVRFLIVGEGPLQEALLERRARLGLEREVIFTGFRRDIGAILRMLDVFVLSSYLEGLGTSMLDAMLVGLPVVATRVGGIPEAVKDGENGLLVPPRSPEALSEAICRLLEDRAMREQLGRRGKVWVHRFDIRETVRRTEAVYVDLLSNET